MRYLQRILYLTTQFFCIDPKHRTPTVDGMSCRDVCRRALIFSWKVLPLYHFSIENSHLETRHQGVMFRSPRPFVGSTATLRYEPCTQFINVSQRALHIYWQFSAMSHAIHKIVSKRRCQSYFISRRSPHHGISKDSDLCASAHRCL